MLCDLGNWVTYLRTVVQTDLRPGFLGGGRVTDRSASDHQDDVGGPRTPR